MAKAIGLRRRSRIGAKTAAPAAPAAAGAPPVPWSVRLSVWGGVALVVASSILGVTGWERWEPDPLLLSGAAVAFIGGVWLIAYYFTKAGDLK